MTIALAAVAALALADWWTVFTHRRALETIVKPLVMVALIATALLVDADPATARPWVIAGLACGLVGDVCLLPHVDRFVAGLGAFLAGHVAYAVALALMFDGVALAAVGVVVATMIVGLLARPIVAGLRGSRLRTPVIVYMAIVTAIVVLGTASGRWPVALGTAAFAVSDGLLGTDRFVAPAPRRRVLIHVLYHLGQTGIVVGTAATFA